MLKFLLNISREKCYDAALDFILQDEKRLSLTKKSPLALCIDDSKTVISFLRAYLNQSGYRVETALDGEEGLAKMRSENPDIVLLDLNMPKLSGFDVALAATSDPVLQHIPIIIVTSLSQPHNKERSELRNVRDYLTKPINPAVLIETVQKHINA